MGIRKWEKIGWRWVRSEDFLANFEVHNLQLGMESQVGFS
jgi:hypothetical protein